MQKIYVTLREFIDGEQQEGTLESYHMNGELKKFDENGKLLNP